jgi:hypothetical protein
MDQLWLWLLAIPMAYTSAWLLKKASNAKSSLDNAIVFYILVMMASMFGGAVLYYLVPTITGIDEALGLNMIVMSVGVIAVLRYWTTSDIQVDDSKIGTTADELELEKSIIISRAFVVYFLVMMASMTATGIVYIVNTALTGLEEGLIAGTAIMTVGVIVVLRHAYNHSSQVKISTIENRRSTRSKLVRSILVSFILLNEFLMGWSFTLAYGSPKISTGSLFQVVASTLTSVTGSDWFLFTMVLEMLLTIYMLRDVFSKNFIGIVCLQSAAMFFVPTAINSPMWVALSETLEAVISIGLAILAYEYLIRNRQNYQAVKNYVLLLLLLYSAMIAGFLIWISEGNSILLLGSVIGEIVLYFNAILEKNEMGMRQSTGQVFHESFSVGR